MPRPWPRGTRSVSLRLGLSAVPLLLLLPSGLLGQTTFTVNTTDDVDDGVCDVAHCSLREALHAANAAAGGATVAFNIPGAGPHTIRPTEQLPTLMDDVTLDGTTEPDFAGTPVIELDGSNAGGFTQGLLVAGSGNTIRGLAVNRFSDNGISLGSGSEDNVVEGCYVGTDVTGTVDLGNGNAGVMIGQSKDNRVGGTTAAARNVISGNPEGVTLVDVSTTGNLIQGNYIGTNAAGTAALPNNVGILLLAPDNTVGGTAPGAGNVISGNTLSGVDLGPPNATGNLVAGNYIGVDATGAVALGNDVGVFVNNVTGNTIGGTSAGARNVISGNREGIDLWLETTSETVVQGNYVGTNAAGTAAVPNENGIVIYGPDNLIGGTEPGAGNLISGNTGVGIFLFSETCTGNLIQGNHIGLDASGTAALGNPVGVFASNAPGNTIGGTTAGARNVVSGNTEGITFWDAGSTGNVVLGNYVGTDPTGTSEVPNVEGIVVYGSENTIGGTEAGAGNLVSGNTNNGVLLAGLLANGNLVQGNRIGTDASGGAALGNGEAGVSVGPSSDNVIGGSAAGAGNLLSGNKFGVIIGSLEADGTVIQGNTIGTDATGTSAVPNQTGVLLWASNTVIGGSTTGARNLISGNLFAGIDMGEGTHGTLIRGNYIGTDVTGSSAIPNSLGISVNYAPDNTIGGTGAGEGNLISGNGNAIHLNGGGAKGNLVQGNTIGPNAAKTAGLPNDGSLVIFFDGATENTLGGSSPGAGNVVAYASLYGIELVPQAGAKNHIQGNAIYENSTLGIDLGSDGVTANDPGDVDAGPNNYQNFPVLSAVSGTGAAVIRSTLNGAPSSTYTLDFYANPACHTSGYGEGRTFLGSGTLTTDASGNGSSVTTLSGATGPVFTATATDASLNTSEFSACASLATLGVAGLPTTATVRKGETASYSVTVALQGGTLDDAVDLACSGAPAKATCSFGQSQVTPTSGQASTTMTVTTAKTGGGGLLEPGNHPLPPLALWLGAVTLLAWLAIRERSGRLQRGESARSRRVSRALATAGAALVLLVPLSCGDGGTGPDMKGTPVGTYQVSVIASWQSVQATTTVTLVVEK